MSSLKLPLLLLALGLVIAGLGYLPSFMQEGAFFPAFIIIALGGFLIAFLKVVF